MRNRIQGASISVCFRPRAGKRYKHNRVTSILKASGYQVTERSDGPLDIESGSVLWILGNANWFPKVFRQLESTPQSRRPLVVLWHFEPLPPPKESKLSWPRLNLREIGKILLRDARATDVYTNYFRLRRLVQKGLPDLLVVSTLSRHEFLAEKGIAATWVPLGYSKSIGQDMELQRDINVLFLGALNIPRRKRNITHLRRRGVNILTMGSWSDPTCWGDNRTRLLNRTKIFLNILRFPGELSGLRLILGMANKALVISEPMYNPAPFVPGKHYINATIKEMPEIIRYYLTHEYERKRIVNEAYLFVTQELTMERSVSRILELIRERFN